MPEAEGLEGAPLFTSPGDARSPTDISSPDASRLGHPASSSSLGDTASASGAASSSPGASPPAADFVELTSAEDPRLSAFHALRTRRADPRSFVAESELAVRRLLASGWPVDALLTTPSRAARLASWPEFVARSPRPQVFVGPRALLSAVVGYDFHRGCAAAAPRPERATPPAGLEGALVVAVGLSDPANLGALLRNARAFGAGGALIDPQGADPLEPRAIRAAMGATFGLPWWRPASLLEGLEALRELRYTLVAATLGPRARPLPDLRPPERFALLVGNEGAGLSASLVDMCALEVTIPMAPGADSLNVAAASAVLLYGLLGIL